MTKETILKKAIEKAIKNGYKNFDWDKIKTSVVPINNVIFSHLFAKAFWGEEKIITGFYNGDFPPKEGIPYQFLGCYILKWNEKPEKPTAGFVEIQLSAWQYHLQKLVLEKEPLKYLKKFL